MNYSIVTANDFLLSPKPVCNHFGGLFLNEPIKKQRSPVIFSIFTSILSKKKIFAPLAIDGTKIKLLKIEYGPNSIIT
jgi:hypothetical protein